MGMETYAKRIENLHRRYRVLQRRTILYGLLAMVIAQFVTVWVVLQLHLTVASAVAVGAVSGAVFAQIAAYIVRRLNPLSEPRGRT